MSERKYGYITFLSDYGYTDEFVGVCHGVIKRIAPQVEIIDITHGIRPQSVFEGAMVLAQSVAYMPHGVHLAIVDPSVGAERLALAIRTVDGSVLVGPDNGLLSMAVRRLGGADACHQISNPEVMLEVVSKTFQGRDIFAPAAAHLANGVAVAQMGAPVDPAGLVGVDIAAPRRHDDHYHATVLHVDRFGNLQLNLGPKEMADAEMKVGDMLEVRLEGHRSLVAFGETFASVGQGELVVTEDSYGLLAVAMNRGSAADLLGASIGSSVIIGP
ncbi:MAG TPA: SAM-dependent chlorinase/fluorinase, partial [Actinomycetota bacterium]|nr:SAM-dependent chlorinase/fluorinase [Actinomycetota bacterium]